MRLFRPTLCGFQLIVVCQAQTLTDQSSTEPLSSKFIVILGPVTSTRSCTTKPAMVFVYASDSSTFVVSDLGSGGFSPNAGVQLSTKAVASTPFSENGGTGSSSDYAATSAVPSAQFTTISSVPESYTPSSVLSGSSPALSASEVASYTTESKSEEAGSSSSFLPSSKLYDGNSIRGGRTTSAET